MTCTFQHLLFLTMLIGSLINRLVFSCSAIMSESSSKLHQGTRWSSRHAFPQVRNFIFVAHHTSNVQMGPMRNCNKLSEECSCSTCTSRPKRWRRWTATVRLRENTNSSVMGSQYLVVWQRWTKTGGGVEKMQVLFWLLFSHYYSCSYILCYIHIWSRSCNFSPSLQRNIPAVFANVVEVCQLAVSHLSGVVLEQRHPPHSVTCHNTSLCRCVHTYTDTHTLLVILGAERQRWWDLAY